MADKHLHIISFDVPFPADYGGAIDVFYRIKALSELGVKITLHCFEYGRGKQEELEKYCTKVYYYDRKKKLIDFLSSEPFIVRSRRNKYLLQYLLLDTNPILFEGIHTTAFLDAPELKNRVKLVRTHNIEHDYYLGLARETSGIKKHYFKIEARKLQKGESILSGATAIFAIKDSDKEHFSTYSSKVFVLPPCTDDIMPIIGEPTQKYSLFHGNLSVEENDQAAQWLINEVFSKIKTTCPLLIAGKNPTNELILLCEKTGIDLIQNPSKQEMESLIQQARIHVLYTNQATGVKLKLIQSLQTNGYIVANSKMVDSQTSHLVEIAKNGPEFQEKIKSFEEKEMDKEALDKRLSFLQQSLNAKRNCEQILQFL